MTSEKDEGGLQLFPDGRVGHGATSVLEALTRDYIAAHTVPGRGYVGDAAYLVRYAQLRAYNAREEVGVWPRL